jgi:hypothetical protein
MKSHLDRVVRGGVEETLNTLLDAEADRPRNAQRYERTGARLEEALIETYLAGVSVRLIEDITETSWGDVGAAGDGVGPEQEDLRGPLRDGGIVPSRSLAVKVKETSRTLRGTPKLRSCDNVHLRSSNSRN